MYVRIRIATDSTIITEAFMARGNDIHRYK